VGEWNAWKMTQYEITCSTLSPIIESRLVVKYARNGPWRSAAKDVPVGAVALVRAMRSGYRNAHGGPGGPPCARGVRSAVSLRQRDLPETASVRRGDDVPAVRLAERQVVDRGVRNGAAKARPDRRRRGRRDECANVGGEHEVAVHDQQVVARCVRKVPADVGPVRAAVLRLEDMANASVRHPVSREAAEH